MKITTVTSSSSRAIVHSDWIVYIAEPSPSQREHGPVRARDRRADRDGQPLADRAAGERRASRGAAAPAVCGGERDAGGLRLVGDDRALRAARPRSPGRPRRRSARRSGAPAAGPPAAGRRAAGAERLDERLEAADDVVARDGELVRPRSRRARGSSSCRDRRRTTPAPWRRRGRGARARRAAPRRARRGRRAARRAREPGAALDAGREDLGEQLRAGRRGDLRRPRSSAALAQRAAAEQDRRLGRRERSAAATVRDGLGRGAGGAGGGSGRRGPAPSAPARRRRAGSASRPGRAGPARRRSPRRRPRSAPPCSATSRTQRRHVAGDRLDVGLQLRVVLRVVGRVVADDVDDRRACPCARCGGWRGRCPARSQGAAASRPGPSAIRA